MFASFEFREQSPVPFDSQSACPPPVRPRPPLIFESVHVFRKVSGVDFEKFLRPTSMSKVLERFECSRKLTFFVEVDVIRFGYALVAWPAP